jgi:type III pantothenate kinase
MNLVIDAGNTLIKAALFEQNTMLLKYQANELEALKEQLNPYLSQIKNAIIASVQVDAAVIAEKLQLIKTLLFSAQTPVPFKILYETHHSIGADRLAVVAAAQHLFPFARCLAIQLGTCITYEYIDENGNYYGGGISPGLQMRFAALHHFTARLPLLQKTESPPLVGTSTEKSMQSGVINGMTAEINGIIEQYQQKYAPLQVLISGGDTFFFESKIKHNIFAMPYAVLYGLNTILNYNVSFEKHHS